MGDIGEPLRKIKLVPVEAPADPDKEPVPEPREPVPA